MFGFDITAGLKMLKKVFLEEKIKSIVLFLDKENEVQMQKLETNLLDEFADLLKNCPEAKKYLVEKANRK